MAQRSARGSSTTVRPHIASTLPPDVITCLKNSRFLHLATCDAQTPHVSLMNYTYLPSTPFSCAAHEQTPSSAVIIMTVSPTSQKTLNLIRNPRVSMLVHDWSTHRPPTTGQAGQNAPRSGLASLLFNMNTSALSRISATINGDARVLEVGSEEEQWCKARHVENNTFHAGVADERPVGDDGRISGLIPETSGISGGLDIDGQREMGDGGTGTYIEGDEVRVVVVKIKDGRISDWKGGVQDFTVLEDEHEEHMVNGVL